MQALRRVSAPAPVAGAACRHIWSPPKYKDKSRNIRWPYWMHEERKVLQPTFGTKRWEKIFADHRTILVWQIPSMSIQRFEEMRYAFFLQDMSIKRGAKKDSYPFIMNSKYRHLARVLQPEHAISYTNETNIKQQLKLVKPFSNVELIGGVIDETLLSREELMRLTHVTSIEHVHSELVGVLSTPAYLLSAYLQKHAEGPGSGAAAAPSAAAPSSDSTEPSSES